MWQEEIWLNTGSEFMPLTVIITVSGKKETMRTKQRIHYFNKLFLFILSSWLLVSCSYFEEKDKKIEELQAALNAASHATQNLQKNERDLQKQVETLNQNLDKERERNQQLKEEAEKARLESEKASQERQKLQDEWNQYREKYRADIRLKAVGEKYDTLTLSSGGTFANVTVKRVDAAYVHIVHDRGVARLPFTELGGEWTDRFDYDPVAAAALLADEKQKRELADAHKTKQDQIMRQTENKAMREADEERMQYKQEVANGELQGKYATLRNLMEVIIKRHNVPPHYYTTTDSNGNSRQVAYYDYTENSWVLAVQSLDVTVTAAQSLAREIKEFKQKRRL